MVFTVLGAVAGAGAVADRRAGQGGAAGAITIIVEAAVALAPATAALADAS